MKRTFAALALAAFMIGAISGCSSTVATNDGTNSRLPNAQPKAAAIQETPHLIGEKDGISVLAQADKGGGSWSVDASGKTQLKGWKWFVKGSDGKLVQIVGASADVKDGELTIKDIGTLRVEFSMGSGATSVFATDTQIQQLRTLQASGPNIKQGK